MGIKGNFFNILKHLYKDGGLREMFLGLEKFYSDFKLNVNVKKTSV